MVEVSWEHVLYLEVFQPNENTSIQIRPTALYVWDMLQKLCFHGSSVVENQL